MDAVSKFVTRRAWWWLSAIVLAGALLGCEIGGWPFLRAPVQDFLTQSAAVPVALNGRFHLRLLWRPTLQVEHLQVGPGGGIDAPLLLDARSVDLGWRLRDLWQWRRGAPLRVHRLHADVLQAHLLRTADGRASWQLGRAADGSAAADELPRVGSLRVRDGRIVIDDAITRTRLQLQVHGGEGEPAGDGAGYRIAVDGSYGALPLALKMRSGSVLALWRDPQSDEPETDVPLHIEGRAGAASLRFDGRVGALLGDRRVQGALHLRGPSLAQVARPLGVVLPQTPPFDLKGTLHHTAGIWQLQAERGAIGSSLLEGDFRLDTRARPSRLQGRLGGRRLALADLGPAVGAPPGEARTEARQRVLPQRRLDLPSLREMDADVEVAVDELDLGSDAIRPLLGLRTRLHLQEGVLRLHDLQARVAGGWFRGTTHLDANVAPARWLVDMRFGGIDIAGWVAALQRSEERAAATRPDAAAAQSPRRARAGAYLTGELSGAVKAGGRGRSAAEVLGSLDGRMQLMLRAGTLSHLATEAMGLDVAEALGVVVRGDRPLPIRCGWIDLVAQNGLVHPQVAVLDNDDTELRITGQVNMRDESLALRLVARPKDVSPFTLRTPVTLTGTLASPQVGVETERLVGKALGSLALGAAIGPLAALLPFVDLGVGDENDACARKPAAPASAGTGRR